MVGSEKTSAPVKLGIMGGTFDPIHFGHLFCAEQAADAFGLDKVLFVPAGSPAFKQERCLADTEDRLNMCKLAVADNPAFAVSDVELAREGISYTVDTLRQLKEIYPAPVSFSFILGSDAVMFLDEWKDKAHLSALTEFICVTRPGFSFDEDKMRHLEEEGFKIRFLEAPLLDISSTEIRDRVQHGRSIRYMTPLCVCDYIASKGLYAKDASATCLPTKA